MSFRKFAVTSRKPMFYLALILILAVGALASGVGIWFQGFETDTSAWLNDDSAQEIFRQPSGFTDNGGYANGIASATGNYHARLVPDTTDDGACLDNGAQGAPPNNDCYGPFTYWNEVYSFDGVTNSTNVITSATLNFTAAEAGFVIQAYDSNNNQILPTGTTITSVTNSTTIVVSNAATETTTGVSLNVYPVFPQGFITQADIYLDTNWAANNSDWRFDWDSALTDNTDGADEVFLSDYVFNVGTQLAGDNTPGFWVSTSPNAGRANSYPENGCPGPSGDDLGNYCRAPVKITTSGWYTFRHIFRINPNTQNLSIEFQVLPLGGNSPLVDTTIYGWQGTAQAPAGGITAAYGWFPNMEIPQLALDDTLLKDFDTLTLTPTAPSPLGAGTPQTFDLSATFDGIADPLTPGLTPANFAFTPGNSDTGTVTVVPSGTQPGNGTLSFAATGGNTGSVNLTANIDGFSSNTASFNVITTSLYSPVNGSTLTSSSVTFQWTEYPGATNYWLDVGSTQGANNYEQTGSLSNSTLSFLVNGLPTNGSTVYATWYYLINGSWQHTNYSYTTVSGVPQGDSLAAITSPTPSSMLTGYSTTFSWSPGTGPTAYWLDVGSTVSGNQYYTTGSTMALSAVVNSLPTNGSTVYVTLYSLINGTWFQNAYTYTAFNALAGAAQMQTPTPSSILSGSSVTFTWQAGANATAYWIDVGSSPGGDQYLQSGSLSTSTLSTTVSGLPTDGSNIYVTLYSYVGGWVDYAYTYSAYNSSPKAVMRSPTPGSTLPASTVTFTWNPGTGSTAYWLDVGPTVDGNQYYQSGNLGSALTATVTGLPIDGSPVYVTLYSLINGQWQNNEYSYSAFSPLGALAVMQTPTPSSTLSGNSATFTWSAGNNATGYWLDIGSVAAGNQYYQSGNLGNVLTTTVSTLPENGSTIYVTLYTLVGGQWFSNSYTYNSSLTFQGFETGTGDWNPTINSNNQPVTTTYQVASGGGVLELTAASGNYYAEVHNIDNDYYAGYFGDSGYSYFGYGIGNGQAPANPTPYPGDFSQSIMMYINVNWPVALYGGPGVWIDETPGNFIAGNYGSEHNFRLTPTGSTVLVYVDGNPSIATITTSGWYNFQMTFQKAAPCNDGSVTTNMNVFDANANLIGTTTVCGDSPGGPQLASDLAGPGYVWITVWPNGWAGDVLGIDNVRVDLLN